MRRQSLGNLCDLGRKLFRGCEDQDGSIALVAADGTVEDGEKIGGGFSSACAGPGEDIFPLKCQRNSFCLDRLWGGPSLYRVSTFARPSSIGLLTWSRMPLSRRGSSPKEAKVTSSLGAVSAGSEASGTSFSFSFLFWAGIMAVCDLIVATREILNFSREIWILRPVWYSAPRDRENSRPASAHLSAQLTTPQSSLLLAVHSRTSQFAAPAYVSNHISQTAANMDFNHTLKTSEGSVLCPVFEHCPNHHHCRYAPGYVNCRGFRT